MQQGSAEELRKEDAKKNTCRLDFAPTEAVALGKALEAIERPKAKERQGRPGKRRKEHSGKLPEHNDTRDAVGSAVGMSGENLRTAVAPAQRMKGPRRRNGVRRATQGRKRGMDRLRERFPQAASALTR